MIDTALSYLKDRLNTHLVRLLGTDGPAVILSPLNPQSEQARDKILLSLINTSHDPMPGHGMQKTPIGGHLSVQEPLVLDLYLMVSAHYPDNYQTGLGALSHAIDFLHSHPIFTHQTDPDLPKTCGTLRLEWSDHPTEDQLGLWRAHGATYRPSAIFKLRGVTLGEQTVSTTGPITSSKL